jgi:small GTP-binding protein
MTEHLGAAGGLLRICTAGSVDDGKSTLIGRLLYDSQSVYEDQVTSVEKASKNRNAGPIDFSLFTDGLRAEREQGITIDVAYRYFATARRKFILADTPGHEQYTRNMATGASTADVAILLVDARNGVRAQSRRHAQIARLLELHREAGGAHLKVDEPGSYESHTRATSALICGDFNLPPDDAQYHQMLDGDFADAWAELNPGKPRQATFHLYDGETPYCCDYIFVTADLVPRLKSIRIDTATRASDHQPVILDLA